MESHRLREKLGFSFSEIAFRLIPLISWERTPLRLETFHVARAGVAPVLPAATAASVTATTARSTPQWATAALPLGNLHLFLGRHQAAQVSALCVYFPAEDSWPLS